MPVLTADNIHLQFNNRRILDGVSFSVNQGDRIAFIGNNGAGKSSLFRIIKGVQRPDEGRVVIHGNAIAGFLSQNMDEQDLTSDSILPKELMLAETRMKELESLMSSDSPRETLDEYAKVTAKFESLGGYDYEYRFKEALAGLGLKDISDRVDLMTLSGGEKMRICLARLIVDHPDILMLDEPTNHLDADAVEWLEEYLEGYNGCVFVITHDRHFINSFANRVIELDGGKISLYKGNYDSYRIARDEFIKTQQALVSNLQDELEHQLDVKQTMLSHRNISGYHQREKMVDRISAILERERAKLPSGEGRMNFRSLPRERTGTEDKLLISVKDISMSFGDGPVLFENLSFELKAGQKLFLAGPNGCGKTTLLSILRGRVPGLDGSVFVSSSATMGFMEQFVPFENEEASCYDELIKRSDLTVTQARSMLARFGFRSEDVFKSISVLSGGERSRLYLCCILEENPDILFLDEPTNHLDIESKEILEDALKEYSGAIICVSHDRFFIDKCADSVLGFCNRSAKIYDNYEMYRKSARRNAEHLRGVKEIPAVKDNEDSSSSSRNKSSKAESGMNPAKLRRMKAQRQERMREIEALIEQKEAEQKTLEELFITGEAGKEDYDLYACNASVIEKMYDEYESLC